MNARIQQAHTLLLRKSHRWWGRVIMLRREGGRGRECNIARAICVWRGYAAAEHRFVKISQAIKHGGGGRRGRRRERGSLIAWLDGIDRSKRCRAAREGWRSRWREGAVSNGFGRWRVAAWRRRQRVDTTRRGMAFWTTASASRGWAAWSGWAANRRGQSTSVSRAVANGEPACGGQDTPTSDPNPITNPKPDAVSNPNPNPDPNPDPNPNCSRVEEVEESISR